MPSFNDDPASFVDLHTFFPTLDQNVGLSHEQVRAIIENIYWNYNHLSEANIEIGETRVVYAPAGSPFDVDISHRKQYDEHGCVIKDIWDFVFTVAVARMTASASASAGETASVIVTPTELQDHTGYNFGFAFTLPRGVQGIQGASFRNKGAYDSTQTYVNNSTYIDFVSYEGSLYAAKTATVTGELPTNTTYWDMMVRRGYGISSVTKTGTSGLQDTYTITYEDGSTSTFVITNGATPDVSGKADKVANATAGNIATLDANGNLTDSGVAPTDLQENLGITAQDIQNVVSQISYLTGEAQRLEEDKQNVFQFSTMPMADATWVDKIVQYTGATTNDYTNGHFYKGVYESNSYSWVEVELGGGGSITLVTTIDAQSTDSEAPSAKAVWTLSTTKQDTIDSTHKLSADLVDDTNSTNKFVTASEKARWNAGGNAPIFMTNVSASTWVADSTYTDFGYKCVLSVTGVTADNFAMVVFGVPEAVSGNYAPVAETGAGTITIYSKVDTAITIPTIRIENGTTSIANLQAYQFQDLSNALMNGGETATSEEYESAEASLQNKYTNIMEGENE